MRRKKKLVYLTSPFLGKSKKLTGCWLDISQRLKAFHVKICTGCISNLPKRANLVILENLMDQYKTLDRLKNGGFNQKERLMLCIWEPPVVDPSAYIDAHHVTFGKIGTLHDNLPNNDPTYFHFNIPQPTLEQIEDEVPFEKKSLLTMICSNKSSSHRDELYSARRRLIEHFDAYDDFHFYGVWWEYLGYQSYCGAPKDKLNTIKNYRFCISYENTKNLPGYITEKIFDCFLAKCVPIYWGAPNVRDYIPSECFIDREQFTSLDELYTYLKSMGQSQYQSYLDAAKIFLKSDAAKRFSMEYFTDQYVKQILATVGNL